MGSLSRAAILKGLALHIKKAGFEDYSNTYTAIDFEEEHLGGEVLNSLHTNRYLMSL